MSRRFATRFLVAAVGALALSGLLAARADAANAVLSQDGTLYEVFSTTYGQLSPDWPNRPDAANPVLALRTTPPGGAPTVELVSGTNDAYGEIGEAIEFDDSTQTVFVVYTRLRGFFTDVRVAIRRGGLWAEGSFLPNPGFYVSMNARLVVTRQIYKDLDDQGNTVTKARSILSIVWWEESNLSQARFAPISIDDGGVQLNDIVAYDLNPMTGDSGATDKTGLPQSSYQYPAVQRDLSSNGGVFVSFANLASRTQEVLRLGFPDDFTTTGATGRTSSSRSSPIGRGGVHFHIPTQIDLPFMLAVGTIVSPTGVPTFYWDSGANLSYLRAGTGTILAIPYRTDFPFDRALAVMRDMSEKE